MTRLAADRLTADQLAPDTQYILSLCELYQQRNSLANPFVDAGIVLACAIPALRTDRLGQTALPRGCPPFDRKATGPLTYPFVCRRVAPGVLRLHRACTADRQQRR